VTPAGAYGDDQSRTAIRSSGWQERLSLVPGAEMALGARRSRKAWSSVSLRAETRTWAPWNTASTTRASPREIRPAPSCRRFSGQRIAVPSPPAARWRGAGHLAEGGPHPAGPPPTGIFRALPHEAGREAAPGAGIDPPRRPGILDPTLVHHHDQAGQR